MILLKIVGEVPINGILLHSTRECRDLNQASALHDVVYLSYVVVGDYQTPFIR